MKTVKQIISYLEKLNIQVHEYKENKKLCGYELNTYTDAGVNIIIFLDFRDSEMNPRNAKHFIDVFNERVNDIDISEELKIHSQDARYMQDIGYKIGIQDFKAYKESMAKVFTIEKGFYDGSKTPQQRQFEQVKDKLIYLQLEMGKTLDLMPTKGVYSNDCQKMALLTIAKDFKRHINGIELEDFTPNEYSNNFKLAYS